MLNSTDLNILEKQTLSSTLPGIFLESLLPASPPGGSVVALIHTCFWKAWERCIARYFHSAQVAVAFRNVSATLSQY